MKALEVSVVVVAAEGDGHLAADGRVPDGGKGGGKTAIDPTLLEVPEGRNDQMVFPRRSKSVLSSTGFQLEGCNFLPSELSTLLAQFLI